MISKRHSIVRQFQQNRSAVRRDKCCIVSGDSRTLLPTLPDSSVDCIITSPPYGDLKNYGGNRQIGYGQNTNAEYFPDLRSILAELHRIAKPGAAVWVVLDTWRSHGKTIALPMEVLTLATEVGFQLHDFVVWDKGKSLPWSHRGRFRGVCEYVLLLAKGRLKKFDLTSERDSNDLASYWVRYPERYHPDGKALTDLWHVPIPVQGSWGRQHSRHFCPFPIELVVRMLRLTTSPGDIVLDPFAGTCTVPAIASFLGRWGLGIELNTEFVGSFKESGYRRLLAEASSNPVMGNGKKANLRNTIIDLRILKFSRALFAGLSRRDKLNSKARASVASFVLTNTHRWPQSTELDTRKLARLTILVLAQASADKKRLASTISELLTVPPLTKFGVSAVVKVIPYTEWRNSSFTSRLGKGKWYVYRKGVFFKYDKVTTSAGLRDSLSEEATNNRAKVPAIYSRLSMDVDVPVPDYA
jgi:DNA modification methylase